MDNKIIIREAGEQAFLSFYAIVFDQLSRDLWEDGVMFRERILTGALDGADLSNVVATLFHDKTKILGRTKAGTLTLKVDEYGLLATITLGNTQLHRDAIELVKRGDLFECSFIGLVTDWSDAEEDGVMVRTIKRISLLRDVSIVDNAAYPNTNIIREFMSEEKKEATREEPAKEEVREETPEETTEETREETTEEAPEEETTETEEEVKEEDEPAPVEAERSLTKKTKKMEVRRSGANPAVPGRPSLLVARDRLLEKGMAEIAITRAAADGDTTAMADVIPKGVAELSILGKAPLWARMGVDLNPGAQGTYELPYQSPMVGEKLAELASVTKDTLTPTGTLVKPRRFSAQKILTLETLASASADYFQKIVDDLNKAADRAITAEVYAKILAGAQATTTGAITKTGFDALRAGAEIEMDGAFFAPRATFFEAAGVPVDAGSGIFLAKLLEADRGLTSDGEDFFFSTLFEDPEDEKYVAYGDPSFIHVADYGMSELIVDKYTLASKGQIILTFNKLADVALKNPYAFSKTPDLLDSSAPSN
jgi:HK97 family phage prohead protease